MENNRELNKSPSIITLISEKPEIFSLKYITRQAIKVYKKRIGFKQHTLIGGPENVEKNLTIGLNQLGQAFKLNPTISQITPLVGVLSDIDALRWAIAAKQRGRIKFLIAGPNLVVTPLEENGILCAPEIDLVVTPSRWVSEMYQLMAPSLAGKLVEWPIGVDTKYWAPDPTIARKDRTGWLIYDKTQSGGKPEKNAVIETLSNKGDPVTWIVYGKYTHEEYRKKLQTVKAMIVLSPSESQGIAMFEAWACNIPTLVWDRQCAEWKGNVLHAPSASSSPYLTDECGRRFQNAKDFPISLTMFEARLETYQPRNFILDHYTLCQTARNYIHFFVNSEFPS